MIPNFIAKTRSNRARFYISNFDLSGCGGYAWGAFPEKIHEPALQDSLRACSASYPPKAPPHPQNLKQYFMQVKTVH